MNGPNPPEATRSGAPSGDRPQDPAEQPVHSVSFRPSRGGEDQGSAAQPNYRRSWILAGVLALLIAAGGWILQHVRQHPIVPHAVVPHEPAPETPANPDMAAAPLPGLSSQTEPPAPTSPDAKGPTAAPPDTASADAPAALPENDLKDDAGGQAPTLEKDVDEVAAQPNPTRERFRELLSRGLAAMHSGHYRQARDTLQKAAAIDPQSDEVREALSQVDHALKLAQLDGLQRQASAAEKKGAWSKALEMYLAALTIDPNVGFALQGRQRTMRRITIGRRIDFYLTQPETLFNDRHLANAVQLLLDAERVAPLDSGLQANIKKLNQLVTAAQTLVPVTITSDNQTDVAVYKVGRLGRFETQDLRLRPGPYTVTGVRDGYRDVRLRFTVKPGDNPPAVHVVCHEKIQ